MFLRSLNLNHFRCFESMQLSLSPEVTLFHGNNAQGKTSILEAACVLMRLQSPRASKLADCIRFSEKAFAIGGKLEGGDSSELRLQYRESGRRLIVDGETQKRGADYLRHSSLVVWMANDDLILVRGGGESRRRYLDFMASQLYPGYLQALRTYDKALRTRNYLLKRDASPKWPEIDAYTKILSEQGRILSSLRRELVAHLSPKTAEAQQEISGTNENLDIQYECGSADSSDLFQYLTDHRDDEYKKRQTFAGPHRDDLSLNLNGMPAAKFASEGQQRTVALALKLGQTHLFLKTREQPPVLLIDDVFGELDPARRNALMAAWPEASQKLITTTNLDWLDDRFDDAMRLHVDGAAVS
ncbi:MAG: DNA replication/repair protein RecF [Verrucomicrobiales bacterium]|nr:DNA replication/repair protein RecF [Verrucomicrobiales bacterium]